MSRRPGVVGLLGLALLLLVQGGLAQTLRVTTWSLQTPGTGTNAAAANTNGIRIPAAAAALKKLNPDVILLQQVPDWAMCEELAEALKPAKYRVVTCSAFRDARGALRKQQAAILAKTGARPYFSWSDIWRNRGIQPLPGGFAFAALKIGQQRIGLFSVQAAAAGGAPAAKQQTPPTKQPNPATPQERMAVTIEQLLAQVGSISHWATNRVQGIIVGGTFGLAAGQDMALHDAPLQLLQDAGFSDAFEDAPAAARTTVRGKPGPVADYLFTLPASCTTNPSVLRVQVSRRFPVTCDVQLGLLTAALSPVTVPASLPPPINAPVVQPVLPAISQTATAAPPVAPLSLLAPTNAPKAQAQAPPPPQHSKLSPQLLWIISTNLGLVALAATAVLLAWRRKSRLPRPPALLTAGDEAPSAYTVVMGTRTPPNPARPAPGPRRQPPRSFTSNRRAQRTRKPKPCAGAPWRLSRRPNAPKRSSATASFLTCGTGSSISWPTSSSPTAHACWRRSKPPCARRPPSSSAWPASSSRSSSRTAVTSSASSNSPANSWSPRKRTGS